ncbi:hypothetical protein CFC21_096563, partial [Triticum aestivum]
MSSSPPAPTVADAAAAGAPASQLAISNGVLLAAVIFLFMVVVFVFLLYLYAKRFLGANPMLNGAGATSSRFIFVGDSPFPRRGLPASVLRTLPVAVYGGGASPKTPGGSGRRKNGEALECAVCLSEVADGEKVRTLPKCGHRFHVDCIDMWFHSHDTCPLCRAPVGADAESAAEGLPRVPREDHAAPEFPTNVLFWGTHDDVANGGLGGMPPAPAPGAHDRRRLHQLLGLRAQEGEPGDRHPDPGDGGGRGVVVPRDAAAGERPAVPDVRPAPLAAPAPEQGQAGRGGRVLLQPARRRQRRRAGPRRAPAEDTQDTSGVEL